MISAPTARSSHICLTERQGKASEEAASAVREAGVTIREGEEAALVATVFRRGACMDLEENGTKAVTVCTRVTTRTGGKLS